MNSVRPLVPAKLAPKAAGFTLLELLVAAALFLLLMALLLTVISSTTTIASKTSEQIEATRIARESFDLIGRDITSASLPWNRTNANSLQFLVNPAAATTAGFTNRDSMFWQAPVARDATKGNLAILGYFVLQQLTPNSRDSRLQLRRVFIDPKSTNGDYNIYSNSTWLTDTILKDFGPLTADADNSNAQKGWVSDGVLGMWVRCLDKTGNFYTTPYDSRAAKFGSNAPTVSYPANYQYSRLPAFVEVTLVCVAPREIVKVGDLSGMPTTSTNASFPNDITAYVNLLRTNNPGAKSINSFTRKFRLLNSD